MASAAAVVLCGVVLALWLAQRIQRYRHRNRRVALARSANESRLSTPATNSAEATGSRGATSIPEESAPVTQGSVVDLETKQATASHRSATTSPTVARRAEPDATVAVQSTPSSLAATWDEDDLDLIETRAAEHRELRTTVAPLAAFDHASDDSDRAENRPSQSAIVVQAKKPRQTDLFDGRSPGDQPTFGGGSVPGKLHRPSDNPLYGTPVAREDFAGRPSVAQLPTGAPCSDDPSAVDTGAPDAPMSSADSVVLPRSDTTIEIPTSGMFDYESFDSPPVYVGRDYIESLADDGDEFLALDDDETEPEDDTNLLDALPDEQLLAAADDEPDAPLYEVDSDGDRLGDYQKAKRLAAQTIRSAYGDADALWPVLLEIFQASPWPATQRSIERLLQAGTSDRALALATEIRCIWSNHSEFGQSAAFAHGRGERWQYTGQALSQLSWPRAARLADCWSSYPDAAEIEYFLESLFDRWHTSGATMRAFPSFHLYLGYATGDLNGTLQHWPELSFEMDDALQDPFERLQSSDEWPSTRAVLAELGIDRPLTHKPFGPDIEMPDY